MRIRIVVLIVLMMLVVAVQVSYAAQAAQKDTPSLRDYFQALAANPAPVIRVEEISAVEEQIRGMRPDELADALPAIFAVLERPEFDIRFNAVIALQVVAQRRDSADMLTGEYLERITALLDSPDPHLQAAPAYILFGSGSKLIAGALPRLLSYIKRNDRETLVRVETLSVLTIYVPGDPDVIQGLGEILSNSSLDANTRIRALIAIRNSRTNSTEITNAVLQSIDAPQEGVRLAAIGAAQQLGISTLKQAERKLRALENKPDEDPDVKAAVRRALNMIGSSE